MVVSIVAALRNHRILAWSSLVSVLALFALTTLGLIQDPWPTRGMPPRFRLIVDFGELRMIVIAGWSSRGRSTATLPTTTRGVVEPPSRGESGSHLNSYESVRVTSVFGTPRIGIEKHAIFSGDNGHRMYWGSLYVLTLPYLGIVALGLVAPCVLCIVARRLARAQQLQARGMCPDCGYDLRCSGDRCPECGHSRNPEKRSKDV
jgi:hypothetical protein